MGLIRYFDITNNRKDGSSFKVEFMLHNNNELWLLPQNASWEELQEVYLYAKKQLNEGKLFEEEKPKPKVEPDYSNSKKSWWNPFK